MAEPGSKTAALCALKKASLIRKRKWFPEDLFKATTINTLSFTQITQLII